jgi:hypothetical protein
MEAYRLVFRAIGGELRVEVFGEKRDSDTTLAYWREIADEIRRREVTRLLVITHLPGEPMPIDRMRTFLAAMSGLGMEGVRVAYVDAQGFKTPLMETAEILASEHGFRARVFDDEVAAQLWLRHGDA